MLPEIGTGIEWFSCEMVHWRKHLSVSKSRRGSPSQGMSKTHHLTPLCLNPRSEACQTAWFQEEWTSWGLNHSITIIIICDGLFSILWEEKIFYDSFSLYFGNFFWITFIHLPDFTAVLLEKQKFHSFYIQILTEGALERATKGNRITNLTLLNEDTARCSLDIIFSSEGFVNCN